MLTYALFSFLKAHGSDVTMGGCIIIIICAFDVVIVASILILIYQLFVLNSSCG